MADSTDFTAENHVYIDDIIIGYTYDAETNVTYFQPESAGIIAILISLMETADAVTFDIDYADGLARVSNDPETGVLSVSMADGSVFQLTQEDGVFRAKGDSQEVLKAFSDVLDGLSNTFAEPLPDDYYNLTSQDLYDGYILPQLDQSSLTTDGGETAAFQPSFTGGVYIAVGDVDGDGRDDVLIFMPETAQDGSVKATAVAAFKAGEGGGIYNVAGDFNGDGLADARVDLSTGDSFVFSDGSVHFIRDGAATSYEISTDVDWYQVIQSEFEDLKLADEIIHIGDGDWNRGLTLEADAPDTILT